MAIAGLAVHSKNPKDIAMLAIVVGVFFVALVAFTSLYRTKGQVLEMGHTQTGRINNRVGEQDLERTHSPSFGTRLESTEPPRRHVRHQRNILKHSRRSHDLLKRTTSYGEESLQ